MSRGDTSTGQLVTLTAPGFGAAAPTVGLTQTFDGPLVSSLKWANAASGGVAWHRNSRFLVDTEVVYGASAFRSANCMDGPNGTVEGWTTAVEAPGQVGVMGAAMLGFFTGSGADMAAAGGITFTVSRGPLLGGIRIVTDGDHWGVALLGGAGPSPASVSLATDLVSGTSFTPDPHAPKPKYYCACSP